MKRLCRLCGVRATPSRNTTCRPCRKNGGVAAPRMPRGRPKHHIALPGSILLAPRVPVEAPAPPSSLDDFFRAQIERIRRERPVLIIRTGTGTRVVRDERDAYARKATGAAAFVADSLPEDDT